MSLSPGARLGAYEIHSAIGAGGMGEVYRAKDTKLGREVAVKVLPEHLSADPEALARFEREARAVAALSHPNILAIHDFGYRDGVAFAATELLEGDTLGWRLAGGALPVRKAIDYALQIIHGLAAAHEKGIVHRDLKPENLFVTKDGRIKILDFGLARHASLPELTDDPNLPTLSRQTDPGTVLGTAGYMSPEQVRGKTADQRSDIFSFGAVLYEMLTGQRAFRGESAADTLSAILREEPAELSDAGRHVPLALERIVRRCLEKSPEERFHSAHDLGIALESLSDASGQAPAQPWGERVSRRKHWVFLAGGAAGVALGTVVAVLWPGRAPIQHELTAIRYLTYSGYDSSPAASRDGRTITFTSTRDGRSRIWLKQVPGGGEAALTSGPDDFPRFSPDGSSVLFVRTEGAQASLYRTPALGGEPRKLVENVIHGDWSPDGRQVAFVRWEAVGGRRDSVLGVANADGSGAHDVARVDNQSLRHPRWAPDGGWIAAVTGGFQTGRAQATIFLFKADGKEKRTLSPAVGNGFLSSVSWSGEGASIVYFQAESLISENTASTARIIGQDVQTGLARTLLWSPSNGRALDIMAQGRIVFDVRSGRENLREIRLSGRDAGNQRWVSRGGSTDRQPVYALDGEWVVFTSNRGGNFDIWEVSAKTGTVRRLTENEGEDADPAISPDGTTLIWASDRGGHFEIWAAERDGGRPRQVTSDGFDAENPTATREGWIVYASTHPDKVGIWKIRMDGSEATRLVAGTVILPEVSPDGQHALYLANPGSQQPCVRVVRISDGATVPFEIRVETRKNTTAVLGRARWLPAGMAIAFVGQDGNGVNGVFAQDFVPRQDTARTRRPLGGFDPESATESFGLSADGSRVMVAAWEQLFSLMTAEGLNGISPPRRPR